MSIIDGKRVLIFGDSLTHHGSDSGPNAVNITSDSNRKSSSPGDLLASHLIENGASAARVDGRISRSAYNFWRIEDTDQVLKADLDWAPDVVFIFLGTNDRNLKAKYDKAAFVKLKQYWDDHNVETWSIGPPNFEAGNDGSEVVYSTLRSVFGSSRVFDFRSLTSDLTIASKDRVKDGVHFTPAGANTASKRLADAIMSIDSQDGIATRLDKLHVSGFGLAGVAIGAILGLALARRR